MSSHGTVLVITCTDSRLHRTGKPYLSEYFRGKHVGVDVWELATAPGGVRDLVAADAGTRKDALLHAVSFAHDAQRITTLLLVNHSDCAAYGGAAAFGGATDEYRKHAADLRAARDVLRQTIPNLDIRLFFASVEDRSDGPFVTVDEVR